MALADTALPYGLRDIKITPYTDAEGKVLASTSVDLPVSRTLSFSEAEEFTELRGDDRVWTTRGQGASVEWDLESGGLSFDAVKAMFGQTIISDGVAPNTSRRLRRKLDDTRPFFRIEGQAISDSGGDVHVIIYRARATGEFSGEFGDGEFWLTSGSGVGLPNLQTGEDIDVLYDFVQNEVVTPIA